MGLIYIKAGIARICQIRRMKTALSHIGVVLLCLCVTLYGATLSAGVPLGSGLTEMVICSDGGAKTISVDADGNPVSPASRCCDCLTCNAPTTAFLGDSVQFDLGQSQFCKLTVADTHQTSAFLIIAQPQARGPPLAPYVNGVRTMLRCGLVTKDTTV